MTEYTAKKVILKDADNNYLIPYTEKELPSPIAQNGKFLSNDGEIPVWVNSPSGHNLFDFKWTDYALGDESWLRSDTFSWQDGTIYSNAYNHLVNDQNGRTAESETVGGYTVTFYRGNDGHKICLADQETTVANIYTKTGIAWYYMLDTATQRFKLPRTKYGFNGYSNKVGNYIAPGLPNITGTLGQAYNSTSINGGWHNYQNKGYGTGALKLSGTNKGSSCTWSSYSDAGIIDFSAARSNAIYGASSTVQPPATQMYLYFYVGEFSQTATEQTAGLNSESLNKKVDLSSLATIYPIIKMYVSGTSGYNIWVNGYCEQWGRCNSSNDGNYSVTFAKKFANTNYNLTQWLIGKTHNTQFNNGVHIVSLTTTGFTYNSYDYANTVLWRANGYLASGEY